MRQAALRELRALVGDSMLFSRVDDDTIKVTVSGPRKSFSLTVSKLGATRES